MAAGTGLADAGYRGIKFPFEELKAPDFRMSQQWGMERFIAYLRTWSAVQRYLQGTGHDPLPPFTRKLRSLWGNPAGQRRVTWPLFVRAGRRPA